MSNTDCEDALTIKAEFYVEKVIRGSVENKWRIVIWILFVYRYSTFVVKYSWCFLLLGSIICIGLGLAAVLLRDLPDFNDPTKVKFNILLLKINVLF